MHYLYHPHAHRVRTQNHSAYHQTISIHFCQSFTASVARWGGGLDSIARRSLLNNCNSWHCQCLKRRYVAGRHYFAATSEGREEQDMRGML